MKASNIIIFSHNSTVISSSLRLCNYDWKLKKDLSKGCKGMLKYDVVDKLKHYNISAKNLCQSLKDSNLLVKDNIID